MRISCTTKFDITATGVRSNFNKNRIPFRDATGTMIEDHEQWQRSRNKQRNWETINQIISLRVLPTNIQDPCQISNKKDVLWRFSFEIDAPDGIAQDGDPVGVFKLDCKDVPMLTNLDETNTYGSMLEVGVNIFFEVDIDK